MVVVCSIVFYSRNYGCVYSYEIGVYGLLLLFAMIRSVVSSFKVPVVEVAELTNRSHRIPP